MTTWRLYEAFTIGEQLKAFRRAMPSSSREEFVDYRRWLLQDASDSLTDDDVTSALMDAAFYYPFEGFISADP